MGRPTGESVRLREEEAWALRCRGYTLVEIARRLDLTHGAVSKILERIEDRTFKLLEKSIARTKARQTAQLDLIHAEAMRAWERSLADAETEKTTEDADGEGDPTTRRERTVKGQSGNPQHLAQARGALADQRDLLGLNAPTKIAPTDTEGRSLLPGLTEALARAYADRDRDTVPGPLPDGGA